MNNIINGLSIVATPIGNLDDITYRAVKILRECDIIICENPKHSLKLLNKLGIKKKLIALHDYNEYKIIDQIKDLLKNKICVLISDAGSPLISDPGYNLVQYCISNNIRVTSVPFVSSHKLIVFLDCLENIMPERTISICKELTKVNEFVFRGAPSNVKNKILEDKENIKGEFVAVIDRQTSKNQDFDTIDLYSKELKKMATKFSLTDIVEIVHKFTKINKNKIYKWLLKLKK